MLLARPCIYGERAKAVICIKMDLKVIKVWVISFIIALGLMHHSRTRKILHIIFISCLYALICFFGFKEYAIHIIIVYGFIMIIWTLYERRLLFRTFINLHYIRGNNELILQPWTPRWKEEFLNEKLRLNNIILSKWQHIFDKELSSDGIVHIGSTSITNIGLAKPVHDTAIAITTKYLFDFLLNIDKN
ncbi:unnamed protein product [Didymodactylos carnosus]|uniref:Uncharacterized protein n=1 Tax=Didymodactylos carnosus TaxID=1234261 RepID=A0A815J2U4_9BILA|nr:unnamed protein product [Didymodactylos carnosus]CAF4262011.1 unnamed protein product [Didymodactylos carnosus]